MAGRQPWQVRRRAPQLADLRPADPADLELTDESRLADLAVPDVDLSGRSARLLEIDGCQLTGARLASARLPKLSVFDSRLERCDLANAICSDATLTRVEMRGSRLTGASFVQASLRHVLLADCTAEMLSLRFSTAIGLEVLDCRLRGADFTSADLRGTRFVRCDLGDADFSSAQASGCRFIDCGWEQARGITSLAGATVVSSSPYDLLTFAAVLAGSVGITLSDSEASEK